MSPIFDTIGNRTTCTNSASPLIQYRLNALNQYTNVITGASTAVYKYDLDGNLTNNAALSFVWDAENRLSSVVSNTSTVASFSYDYMGRRWKKIAGATTNTFLWDGWLMLEEVSKTGAALTTNCYVHGLDLSGSLQGAGGVGGLLARCTSSGSAVHFYCADGNGNIGQLLDADDGSLDAKYEYAPFGETIVMAGVASTNNAIRFSTKYWDAQTATYYYGYRSYSPALGRWLSRDPIGEDGGENLYGFCRNVPVCMHDVLGLSWWNCCDECDEDDDALITDIRVALKGALRRGSPGVDEAAMSIFDDTATVGNLSAVQTIAGGTAKLAAKSVLLAASKVGISKGMYRGWRGQIKSALAGMPEKLKSDEGVVIWVYLAWEACEKKRCILPWKKYYDWNKHTAWYQCPLGKSGPTGEGFAVDDTDGITGAIRKCKAMAIQEKIYGK